MSAQTSLAGIGNLVGFDQTVEAMYKVAVSYTHLDRLLAALADQLVDGRQNLLLLYLPPAVYETTAALLVGFQVRSADTHTKTLPHTERELELYHRV